MLTPAAKTCRFVLYPSFSAPEDKQGYGKSLKLLKYHELVYANRLVDDAAVLAMPQGRLQRTLRCQLMGQQNPLRFWWWGLAWCHSITLSSVRPGSEIDSIAIHIRIVTFAP